MGQTCQKCSNDTERQHEEIVVVEQKSSTRNFITPNDAPPQFTSNHFPADNMQHSPNLLAVPRTPDQVKNDVNQLIGINGHDADHIYKLQAESDRHIGSDIKFSLNDNKDSHRLADGSIFEGKLVNGLPDGYGKQNFPNGDEYLGYFIKGKRNGTGKMYRPNGYSYHGDFENNKMTGYGVMTYHNGEEYRGQFKNGLHHGRGTLVDIQGQTTEGLWVDGKFQQTV